MTIQIATVVLALQLAVPDTTPVMPTGGPAADAYLDAGARELVGRARERRATVDHSITQYRTVVRDRIALGVRALRRDRQFYLRETASSVLWRRQGPGEIEVLGGREVVPMFSSRIRVPKGLGSQAAFLAFDPADADLVRTTFGDTDRSLRHPLAQGSEAHYRFRSGETTTVRLPDGRTLRLLELQVMPRRQEFYLARGSLWLDADTHALVRAVVRPARAWDFDLDADDDDDVPRFVKPIRAEIRFLAIEYGFWEMRWWLPRLITFEGLAEAGALGGVGATIRYERTYSDYRVTADPGQAAAAEVPLLSRCPRRRDDDGPERLACHCRDGQCYQYAVRMPADTASLLQSEYLPPSIFGSGPALVTAAEMRELTELLERMQPPAWGLMRPTLRWSAARQDLLRYNRVEGLSVGARADVDFEALAVDATLRLGIADLVPDAQLAVTRQTFANRYRLAGYHRLAAVDSTQRPFGLGGSLSAFLLGRDDGDYFRARGVELEGTPPRAAAQRYRWRLFAEQQRSAEKETDFSLPHLFDDERRFRPNLPADRADQVGASLWLGAERGADPAGLRLGADLFIEGSAGTYEFVRPALTLSLAAPLSGRFAGALELAGGASFGELPAQRLWYLGGAGSVRGYAPLSAAGPAFWRARAEIGNALPGARLVLFSDAGWAGARDDLQLDPQLLSAGAGASFLDGLIRFDLARALRGEAEWRAELYVNGRL